MPDSEHRLIKGCIEGKRISQAKLYDYYCPRMITVCMRYAKNREEAEEIMQEGFYRVFKYIRHFKHEGSFEGWIRKIMVNAALQKYKPAAGLHLVIPIEAAGSMVAANDDIHDGLQVKHLLQLIQSLPTGYRLIFNLYVFEGYKHREIAAMLGITEGTSKSNLSDARRILKASLTTKKSLVIS